MSSPTPKVLLATARAHWTIENALHWQLDVSFREDAAFSPKDNGTGNIAALRRRALDVFRRDPPKTALSLKLKRASWEHAFLRNPLTNISTALAKSDSPIQLAGSAASVKVV